MSIVIDPEVVRRMYIDELKSMRYIGKQFGTNAEGIRRVMYDNGIPSRSMSESGTIRRRRDNPYTMDYTFFDTWNPDLAWFLGLMYSDGHIWQDGSRAALTSTDIDLLEQVREVLHSDFRIEMKATTPQLILNGRQVTDHLKSFGLTPAKSLTKEFPDVPDEVVSHFLRGYWDGDGWLTKDKRGYITIGTEIGSCEFVHGIQRSFEKVLGCPVYFSSRTREPHDLNGITIQSNHPVHSVRVYGKKAAQILKWMYADSTPQTRLARKYEKALPYI